MKTKYYICTMIKDEHRYLKEWLDHHLALGFSEIHLFEDEGSKSHQDIVKDYSNVFLYKLSDYVSMEGLGLNVKRQVELFNYFIDTHKEGWCLFIDADEFLRLDDNCTLDIFETEYSNYPGVYLYWKIYGANGHIKRPESGTLYDNYSEVTNYDKKAVGCRWKAFINLSKRGYHYTKNTHYYPDVFKDNINDFWIDHFITMSFEDYIERRIKRGCVTKNNRNIIKFFQINKDMIPLLYKLREEYNV